MNFLKKLFGFRKNLGEEHSGTILIATINDKIMSLYRGEIYEDPLDMFLKNIGMGEVIGGGSIHFGTGELEYCEIEIQLYSPELDENHINAVISKLEELGAPKGSTLLVGKTQQKIEFGQMEGLGIYLDGINLSAEVYQNSDSEALATEISRLAKIEGGILRYWQGNTETALYFYGDSYENIKKSIADLVSSHPECENCRIVRVA